MSFPLVSFQELTKYVLLSLNSQTARKTSECDAKVCFLNNPQHHVKFFKLSSASWFSSKLAGFNK